MPPLCPIHLNCATGLESRYSRRSANPSGPRAPHQAACPPPTGPTAAAAGWPRHDPSPDECGTGMARKTPHVTHHSRRKSTNRPRPQLRPDPTGGHGRSRITATSLSLSHWAPSPAPRADNPSERPAHRQLGGLSQQPPARFYGPYRSGRSRRTALNGPLPLRPTSTPLT